MHSHSQAHRCSYLIASKILKPLLNYINLLTVMYVHTSENLCLVGHEEVRQLMRMSVLNPLSRSQASKGQQQEENAVTSWAR